MGRWGCFGWFYSFILFWGPCGEHFDPLRMTQFEQNINASGCVFVRSRTRRFITRVKVEMSPGNLLRIVFSNVRLLLSEKRNSVSPSTTHTQSRAAACFACFRRQRELVDIQHYARPVETRWSLVWPRAALCSPQTQRRSPPSSRRTHLRLLKSFYSLIMSI